MTRTAQIALTLLLTATCSFGMEPRQGEITYLSRGVVFVNIGLDMGAAPGDTGAVTRGRVRIAGVEVAYVSGGSSSCRVVPPEAEVKIGDAVTLWVKAAETTTAAPEQPESALPDTSAAGLAAPRAVPPVSRIPRAGRENGLSGSFSIQYWGQGGEDSFGYGYSQSTSRLSMEIENIQGSQLSLALNLRTRRTERALASGLPSRWDNRYYEIGVRYASPSSPFSFSFGRMPVTGVAGVGRIDGGHVVYASAAGWRTGVFAGTDPDYESGFRSDRVKAGVFASTGRGELGGIRWNSSLSLLGVYDNGEIDREYAYAQANLSSARLWSVYANGEINVNRGWRSKNGSDALELTYINLNARLSPTDRLNLDAGISNRRNVRTIDNRDIPDSLFDDSPRRDARLRIGYRLPGTWRISAQGKLRFPDESSDVMQPSIGARLSASNVLGSGIGGGLRWSDWENSYTHGRDWAADFYHSFAGGLVSLQSEGGSRNSRLNMTGETLQDNWLSFTATISPLRRVFFSMTLEYEDGDDGRTDRLIIDGVFRF